MRQLILAALVAMAFFWLRKLLTRGNQISRTQAGGRARSGAPEQLVCGECGTAFNPAHSAWLCPKCGK